MSEVIDLPKQETPKPMTLETAQVNAFLGYMAGQIQHKGKDLTLQELHDLLIGTAKDVNELIKLQKSK